MKKISSNKTTKSISVGLLAMTTPLTVFSCSHEIPFQVSSVVPSAEGSAKIKNDDNSNYTIDLEVIRLADPTRLTPAKTGYVVWMETAQNGTKNIGQLKTSSSMMSKTLKSSLQTVTTFRPVRFFITAEDNFQVSSPGMLRVLTTDAFATK